MGIVTGKGLSCQESVLTIMDIEDCLKQDLICIRNAALRAVDPVAAVYRFIDADPKGIRLGTTFWDLAQVDNIYLVGIGKASAKMARAAVEILGPKLSAGVVVTKYGHLSEICLPESIQTLEAGHPIPDRRGLAGAKIIANLLKGTTSRDRILVLLSGGASALMPFPVPAISLKNLQDVTTRLLRSGATIGELNTVRKHLDRLKGGQLAREAYPAPLAALILSDVVGDQLDVIASGPTVPDPTTFQDAFDILEKYGLAEQIPSAVLNHIQSGLNGQFLETPKPGDPLFEQVENIIIGSNRLAAQAAVCEAARLGYRSLLLSTYVEGEAREVGKIVAALGKSIHFSGDPIPPPACLVLGGETTVTVRGSGQGGRNQELALSAAIPIAGLPNVAVMALATDGTDGPTDAAGAMVGGRTIEKLRAKGIDYQAAFRDSNTYAALKAIDELMLIGSTGTNVNDVVVILVR